MSRALAPILPARTLAASILLAPAVVAGMLAASTAAAADPDALGTFEVERTEYGFGDTAFEPTSIPFARVEVRAVVHNPIDLASGPFPMVIMLHGRHPTCLDPDAFDPAHPWDNTNQAWPCNAGDESIPSYIGYDYWAQNLASHGYVVVSISANGIAAQDNTVEDAGATARAELIGRHLELWQAFNTTDEYGTHYNGAVDLQNIGLVGHSRGGEGVARFAVLAAEQDLPYGVEAVIELAPIDVLRAPLPHIALAVVLPYCDGDVYYLDGAHYYDDSRLFAEGDTHPKYTFTMAGSNHNFYNTVWSPSTFTMGGGLDDWDDLVEFVGLGVDPHCDLETGVGRLDEAQQQATMIAFGNAFLRAHLGHEDEFLPFLRGDVVGPATAAPAAVRTAYMPADSASERIIVNAVAGLDSLVTNDLGGAVTAEGLTTYDVCGIDPDDGAQIVHCVAEPGTFMDDPFEGREPHTTGLAQLRLGFADDGRWINELGAPVDASQLSFLQFRAAVAFDDPAYQGGAVDLRVVLVDDAGVEASATVGAHSDALTAPAGDTYPIAPRMVLANVRIPMAAFLAAAPGFDPAAVTRVELVFDQGPGAILLSDVAFADAVPPPMPETTSGSDGSSGGDGTTAAADVTGAASSGPGGTSSGAGESSTGAPAASDGGDGCGCRGAPLGHAAAWMLPIVALLRRRRG